MTLLVWGVVAGMQAHGALHCQHDENIGAGGHSLITKRSHFGHKTHIPHPVSGDSQVTYG